MTRLLALIAVAATATALGVALVDRGPDRRPTASGQAVDFSQNAASPGESAVRVKPETRKAAGRFALRGDRALDVSTIDTVDGMSCLMDAEHPSGGPGLSCHAGVLFDAHKVVFVINSNGGPERFTDEYLVGIAAPEVALIAVEKTDGSTVEARPNARGAFVMESSSRDLELDVHPAELRAYRRSGALLETHEIPPTS